MKKRITPKLKGSSSASTLSAALLVMFVLSITTSCYLVDKAEAQVDTTEIGTKKGAWGVSFQDDWGSLGWAASPDKGSRSWSGTYDPATNKGTFTAEGGWFSATWDAAGGNWIPDIGRGGPVAGPLNKMAKNYNVQWTGTGNIDPNGSNYTFGLKFNLADTNADGTAPGWKGDYDMTTSYEAYIVTHTNKTDYKEWTHCGTFLTPGDPVPYDCYEATGWWAGKNNGSDGNFKQLWAVRKEDTWSGPVNVEAILKFWAEKSGTSFNMSTWHMATGMSIGSETFDTSGTFRLENIRIPDLDTALPPSTDKPGTKPSTGKSEPATDKPKLSTDKPVAAKPNFTG